MTTEPGDAHTDAGPRCSVTTIGATGIEWVCVRPVHATEQDLNRPAFDARGYPRRADRHYFRRRYPNRPTDQEGTD